MIRAQYSMEFILIFAFSLVVIIPIVNLMHDQYASSKQDLDESQARQVLDEIAIATQNTYYSGYPSRTTLIIFFPRGIERIWNQSGVNGKTSELIFNIDRSGSLVTLTEPFPFNISTSLSTNDGKRKILIKAEQQGYVNITDAP